METVFIWPKKCFPEVVTAGRYYYYSRDFSSVYSGYTHAVHLHMYNAKMKFDEAQPIELLPGDVTISPAGSKTSYSLAKPGHHFCIHFMLNRRTQPMVSFPLHIRMGEKTQHAVELFGLVSRSLMQYKMTGSDYAKFSASTGLQRLILYLAEFAGNGETKRGRDYFFVEKLADIIDSEYASEHSVPELSCRIGISQNYLARLFREHYGVTIPHYILTLRIEKAKELLEITDLPIGCIGEYVGLRDPHYFNKMFRKLAGMSPLKYRRMVKTHI